MEIKIYTRSESAKAENEYDDRVVIEIDGEQMFDVHDGEVEDNDLGRNFSDVYSIDKMLIKAHQAGKKGRN